LEALVTFGLVVLVTLVTLGLVLFETFGKLKGVLPPPMLLLLLELLELL